MNVSAIEQVLVDGVVVGSIYGLVGAGFGLIFGVSGRFHFAFSTTFVLAVYITTALTGAGAPLLVGIAGGLAAGAASGVAIEWGLYKPLAMRTGANALLAIFVSSLGLVIIAENVIVLIWGTGVRTLSPGFAVTSISLGNGVDVTNLAVLITVTAVIVVAALSAYLRWSRYGSAIRAVQENPDMAMAVGISPQRVYLVVFGLGSLLGSIASVFSTMRTVTYPTSGEDPVFLAFVVMFLAGVRSSPIRFFAFGILIGIIESASDTWISPTWSTIVVFGVLFVYVAASPYLESGAGLRSTWRRALRSLGAVKSPGSA